MLQFKTWWLKDIASGLSSKPCAKVTSEETSFHNYWKWNTDGSTKSGLAGTSSQQDFTPMATTKSFSGLTLILLETGWYLHTVSWNEIQTSKRLTGYTSFTLGYTPYRNQILWWQSTRATSSKSSWIAYYFKKALAQQCHKVSLHTILIGVMGTICKCHAEFSSNSPSISFA